MWHQGGLASLGTASYHDVIDPGWTPSPVPRWLVKTPSRSTLSPKGERAGFSHTLGVSDDGEELCQNLGSETELHLAAASTFQPGATCRILRGIAVYSIDQDVGVDGHPVSGHLRRVAHGASRSAYDRATRAAPPTVAALAG